MSFGRTTQGQLVSGISSPSTGPATASTAERGCTDRRSTTAAWMASSMVAKSAVWTICGSPALGVGVDDHGEARIGAADVADQDRKFECVRVRIVP